MSGPQFMAHDYVVRSFWPQLYEEYPDFQIWAVDREAGRRATVGYACSVPVGWNGEPSPRGLDWALTDGVEGTPTTLCAVVAGVVPEYRGFGVAETILRRLAAIGAGHGLDVLVAPVRPTWKERYPLVPIQRYAGWRRGDGLPYDPWLRTHERLGGELLASGAALDDRSSGTRAEWEEWTEMVFPEDGRLRRAGRARPGPLQERPRPVRRAQHLGQARVRLAALALLLERAAHLAVGRHLRGADLLLLHLQQRRTLLARQPRHRLLCLLGSWSCFACGSSFRIALASSGLVRSIAAFEPSPAAA